MKKTSAFARKRAGQSKYKLQYSHIHELTASPTRPMDDAAITWHLTKLWAALAAIETAPAPTTDDWRICSDAVNHMETLTTNGPWLDCDGNQVDVADESGLLMDAITALAMAGRRNWEGHHIRLDAKGILAVRSILEDYAAILQTLPERQMIRVHRITERRVHDILDGRRKPHDCEVMVL